MARRKKVQPDRPLIVPVRRQDQQNAVRKDPSRCVLANAIKAMGLAIDANHPTGGVEVGTGKTKLYMLDKTLWEYSTPRPLAPYVVAWDKGEDWTLPEGDYAFNPIQHKAYTPEEKEKERQRQQRRKKPYTGYKPHKRCFRKPDDVDQADKPDDQAN